MKVTTEELERCETLLTVELEPEQQEKMLKKAAQRISREVKIPGFRPGKAPYNVIVRRFGIEAIQSEALEQSVEDLVKEGMADVNITPFAQIQLDGVEWTPALKIKIRIPTRPVIELGSYRDTRLEAKSVEVTEQDVEEALQRLQEQHATWVPVERPAEIGDLISMTVTEKDGDTILSDRQAVEYELKPVEEDEDDDDDDEVEEDELEEDEDLDDDEEDDDDEDEDDDDEDEDDDDDDDDDDDEDEDDDDEDERPWRPDLTTPLLGLSAGESRTFSLTYPEDFQNEQYAGKEITFEVEVSGVKVKELDPLDDEFAKQVGEYETLDALKDKIREDIRQSRERMNNFELGSQALDQIIESAEKVEWPAVLEEEQIDHEIEHYEHHLKEANLTLDAALRVQKKTKEELREELRGNVVKQLKRSLVMSKVAELEKLEVSQMEVLEHVKLMADMYGGGDRMWQTLLASEARQNTIVNDLLSSKVVVRLGLIARGEAPDLDAAETSDESETSAEPAPASEEAEVEPALVSEEAEVELAPASEEAEAELTTDSSPAPVSAADEADEAAGESSETVTNKV